MSLSRSVRQERFYCIGCFLVMHELLQSVEIKIQVRKLTFRAMLLILKHCFVKDSKATISI